MSDSWERVVAAEAAARAELSRVPTWLWDGQTLPVPVETIADSHYGLLVEEAPALASRVPLAGDVHLSGLLYPQDRVILIDADEAARAPGRRRFTITHELGHWVLHCADTDAETVWCRDTTVASQPTGDPSVLLTYPTQELEANAFAAALLMPRELLVAQDRPESTDAEYRLAERLSVSREALLRRYWVLDRVEPGSDTAPG
jgi:hypothetical protein